jgi:hypothetical protein
MDAVTQSVTLGAAADLSNVDSGSMSSPGLAARFYFY